MTFIPSPLFSVYLQNSPKASSNPSPSIDTDPDKQFDTIDIRECERPFSEIFYHEVTQSQVEFRLGTFGVVTSQSGTSYQIKKYDAFTSDLTAISCDLFSEVEIESLAAQVEIGLPFHGNLQLKKGSSFWAKKNHENRWNTFEATVSSGEIFVPHLGMIQAANESYIDYVTDSENQISFTLENFSKETVIELQNGWRILPNDDEWLLSYEVVNGETVVTMTNVKIEAEAENIDFIPSATATLNCEIMTLVFSEEGLVDLRSYELKDR
jgi:hypothetical protein